MGVFSELKARGLIAQMTNEKEIERLLENESITFYIGFDPTADSLHVGHFMQMVTMAHMQRAGHRPIAILGGGTTMVGDPSGRSDMRKMLTIDQINQNAERFKIQMSRFIDFSDGKALMVNNADWLLHLNYVEFLREVGSAFSVNRMLAAECYKSRMEKGLTFLEFNYMIMQSYDFLMLHQKYGCIMQMGGDDQWSNIIGGIELIRKLAGKEAYGMTFQLLTTSEGKKMGKTQSGAVWLDPEKTSPYDFFQYWRNVDDADVIRLLKMLTFLDVEKIESLPVKEGKDINQAKELLAYEVTKLVHGAEEADRALKAARALFGSGTDDDNMPTTVLEPGQLQEGTIPVLDLLILCKLAPSKSEGRRLIEQGGLLVNDQKIDKIDMMFSKDDFADKLIIKKGKKTYHKVTLSK